MGECLEDYCPVSFLYHYTYSHYLDIRYTKNHEWARKIDKPGQVRVGITDYAQKALGDLVFLELPKPGSRLARNGIHMLPTYVSNCTILDVLGIAESVKGASDIYSPIGGTVIDVNSSALTKPSMINKSPESEGSA